MFNHSSLHLCNTQELGRILRKMGADAILATSKRNVGYLGGTTTNVPYAHAPEGAPIKQYAVWCTDGDRLLPSTPVKRDRYDQIVGPVSVWLREKGLERGTLAVEMNHLPTEDYLGLRKALPDLTIVNGMLALFEARMIKTPEELLRIRKAAEVSDKAMSAAIEMATPGVRIYDLARRILEVYEEEGAESVGSFQKYEIVVMQQDGDRSKPYIYRSALDREAKIRKGDHLWLSLIPRYGHYFASSQRLISVGKPMPEVVEMHRITMAMRERMLKLVKPGVTTSKLALAGLQSEAKQDHSFMNHSSRLIPPHGLRMVRPHGIGLDVREMPNPDTIPPFRDYELREGMVLSTDTGARDKELGGQCFVDDLILVTSDGYEFLTQTGREIHIV